MAHSRSSGILLHPTSLPGPFGIGDLGPEAYRFADFLGAAGQKVWQILPLGPTGYGNSPYQCFSAFAGNPLLISPQRLLDDGLLAPADFENMPEFPARRVDFERAIPFKRSLLERAFSRFRPNAEFDSFCGSHAWLEGYARFMALKEANGGSSFTDWNLNIQAPEQAIAFHRFLQFQFFRQWRDLRGYCGSKGIRIMGDIPIYVAHDSADVWAGRDLFDLAPDGRPNYVAGVPPDYFSATGQLWGNPIYRWDHVQQTGFAWWIERFRNAFQNMDMVRLDHFRGFEAYWEVPASETTAVNGRWVKAPGVALFEAVRNALGPLQIVAENLGVITAEVEALREQFGFPGMTVLQFAFGTDPQGSTFLPHNFLREVVCYTGTHDNDTTVGWWNSEGNGDSTRSAEDIGRERAFCKAYLNLEGQEIQWAFLRATIGSVANLAMAPLQDVLGLGSEARMNLPGTNAGHWQWRFAFGDLTDMHAERLRTLVHLYGR